VFKEYLALTAGVLDRDSDYIEKRIGHHPNDRVKMTAYEHEDEEGKEACSFYEVIERFRDLRFVAFNRAQAALTRSACIWRASAARCWPTRFTAAVIRSGYLT